VTRHSPIRLYEKKEMARIGFRRGKGRKGNWGKITSDHGWGDVLAFLGWENYRGPSGDPVPKKGRKFLLRTVGLVEGGNEGGEEGGKNF